MDDKVKVTSLSFSQIMDAFVDDQIEKEVGQKLNQLKVPVVKVQFTLGAMIMQSIVEQFETYEEAAAAYVGFQTFLTQYLNAVFTQKVEKMEIN